MAVTWAGAEARAQASGWELISQGTGYRKIWEQEVRGGWSRNARRPESKGGSEGSESGRWRTRRGRSLEAAGAEPGTEAPSPVEAGPSWIWRALGGAETAEDGSG